ncbi:RYamide receptor-like [Bacillus rossius redtenbacheri]|uniref:RYamide receptor-like n=1 Tax=Bacillus rossius redtenbacheri TaxID=93214 RepID=UPI002FDCD257
MTPSRRRQLSEAEIQAPRALSVFVSAYTLVAISVDRYMAIMWPLRPRVSKRQAKAVIGAVWLVAVLTVLPTALVSRLVQPTEWHARCGKYLCLEDWQDADMRNTYSLILMVLQYIVPLVVLIFTYARIAIVVWGKQIPGEAENSRDQRMARSKRKWWEGSLSVISSEEGFITFFALTGIKPVTP